MAVRSRRGLGRLAAGAGCLVSTVALLAGSSPARDVSRPAASGASTTLRVVQMNLCDSGIAGCYTGRSVARAAAVIRAERPDVVTLNEVCRNDVSELDRTLSGADRSGVVAAAFEPAVDRRTGAGIRCRDGYQYGIGLLVRLRPPYLEYTTSGAVYPTQDTGDPEERVWLCLHVIARFYACTTHLANTSPAVAISQCHYLLDTAIPTLRTRDGADAVLLGADLNLRHGRAPDAQSCVPAGFVRTDDGATQHVVGSSDFTVASSRSVSMRATTDHPGLVVDLVG